MNQYLIVILLILAGGFIVELIASWLNLRSIQTQIPAEFDGYYDPDRYRKSQNYLYDNTRFEIASSTFNTAVTIIFIVLGGFNYTDLIARHFGLSAIPTGLIFGAVLVIASKTINLPFAIFDTFVLEEKYGFNRTTPKTFILDIIKSLILVFIIGGLIFASILWLFEKAGVFAWMYCWMTVSVFQIIMILVAPYVILPLFNKFTPLEDGELKSAIYSYTLSQGFRMKGVFKMDGSKRSGKSNAFFTGFGNSRRIVLFDTLIAKHTVHELVAVVAHEMGHYRKHHILQSVVRSILFTGCTFYLMSLFLGDSRLFKAFKMDNISVYASLLLFGFLYTPISMVFGIVENAISRKHEYEADAYSVRTSGNSEAMINALKRLSVDNLSNLAPHPFKIMLDYSHPPALQRITAIRSLTTGGAPREAGNAIPPLNKP